MFIPIFFAVLRFFLKNSFLLGFVEGIKIQIVEWCLFTMGAFNKLVDVSWLGVAGVECMQ